MPTLTVITHDRPREVPFVHGASLRELLEAAGLWVRAGCRGNGACGLCLVQIEGGNVPSPTRNERLSLSSEQLQQNTRLACQLRPQHDLTIRIIAPGAPSEWRVLSHDLLPCTPSRFPAHVEQNVGPIADAPGPRQASDLPHAATRSTKAAYGLAVDLGTTHISLTLWDLKRGERVSGRVGANPQCYYGSDVLTRLIAAGESRENARRIAHLALNALREALWDLCSRDGLDPGAVVQAAIVGNTPMLALLTETDARALLQPGSWTRPVQCRTADLRAWANILRIHPQANVEVTAACAGFVGSDLLAGVLATRLTDQPGSLLIDLGTNSEAALWDGDTLWVTSAAGGPAFESAQVSCGMPAEPGAVDHVQWQAERHDGAGYWRFRVIGGGEAKGFCGSGLIDLIACLRTSGALTRTGKFTAPDCAHGLVIREKSPTLRLSHADVDMFQRAKAATGVGIRALLARARMRAAELRRICVCGVFGRHLNCHNAQAIGLLPEVAPQRVELCGNTALAGCERLLVSPTAAAELASLRQRATVISLSLSADFEELFLESLYLEPLRVDAL